MLPCGTKPAYFKRIKLPEATDKGSATIDVRALDGAGALLETGRVEVSVRPEETVAAFVELGEAVAPGTGGTGGSAGAGGSGGTAGEGAAAGEGGAGN